MSHFLKLKESWENKVKTEEEVISKVTDQTQATNTVIEQELLNEERQDSDTEEWKTDYLWSCFGDARDRRTWL